MTTQLFFGTPMYHTSVDLISDLNDLEAHAEYSDKWQNDNDVQRSTFLSTSNIIEHSPELNDLISNIARDFVATLNTEVDTSNMRVVDSWFNDSPEGGFVGWHDHGYRFNTISMAYYIEIEDGPIHFRSPNPYNYGFPCQNINEMTNSEITIMPKPMDLFMFPSWLMHKTSASHKGKRKVFSANLQF